MATNRKSILDFLTEDRGAAVPFYRDWKWRRNLPWILERLHGIGSSLDGEIWGIDKTKRRYWYIHSCVTCGKALIHDSTHIKSLSFTGKCHVCCSVEKCQRRKRYTDVSVRKRVDQYIRKSTHGHDSRGYRRGYVKAEYAVYVTRDHLASLVTQPCYYCRDHSKVNGIDRKDNSQPYTQENAVPCCTTCNHAKGTLSVEEFISWARRLVAAQS